SLPGPLGRRASGRAEGLRGGDLTQRRGGDGAADLLLVSPPLRRTALREIPSPPRHRSPINAPLPTLRARVPPDPPDPRGDAPSQSPRPWYQLLRDPIPPQTRVPRPLPLPVPL